MQIHLRSRPEDAPRRLTRAAAAMLLVALSAVTAPSVQATAIDVVTNGGFETGNFAGWSVVNTGSGGCGTNAWVVNSTGAHGCSGNVGSMPSPSAGTFAAYNTFDGPASTMSISQQIVVGGGVLSATLSFIDTVRMNIGGLARTFRIDLYDITNTNLLSNLFTQSYQNVNQGWLAKGGDVTAQLAAVAGQTVTLRVSNIMPQSFTGPAGFGIDNISLLVTQVPAPATLALLAAGLLGAASRQRRAG